MAEIIRTMSETTATFWPSSSAACIIGEFFATQSVVGGPTRIEPPPAISWNGKPADDAVRNFRCVADADIDAAARRRRRHRGAVGKRHELDTQAGFLEKPRSRA